MSNYGKYIDSTDIIKAFISVTNTKEKPTMIDNIVAMDKYGCSQTVD